MAVTWSVASLDSTKTVGSLSDVVTQVHWTASDSETVGEETYTGSSYGSIALAEADASSFTAYADIKESDAVAWAKAAIGADEVTAIETGIAAVITEAKTPTTTSGVPW
jgi:hypothetical protein